MYIYIYIYVYVYIYIYISLQHFSISIFIHFLVHQRRIIIKLSKYTSLKIITFTCEI